MTSRQINLFNSKIFFLKILNKDLNFFFELIKMFASQSLTFFTIFLFEFFKLNFQIFPISIFKANLNQGVEGQNIKKLVQFLRLIKS